MITFSEFIETRNTRHYQFNYDLDNLFTEYNAYLLEEQNKPITSEFLLGLGFDIKYEFYSKGKENLLLNISFSENYASISNEYFEIEIPFPKNQKDVLDLMRLLELN